MKALLESPAQALVLGVIAATALGLYAASGPHADLPGGIALLSRAIHVATAMVWVGLVFFVNLVQLAIVAKAADAEKAFLIREIAPRVAHLYRHASTLTVVTGAVLLLTSGYLLPVLVYGAGFEMPGARMGMMVVGALGGIAMWMFVHMFIWPALQVLTGMRPGDETAKAGSREKILLYARLNLVLSLPVTVLMVAAAHAG